jgi:hypothetical protein
VIIVLYPNRLSRKARQVKVNRANKARLQLELLETRNLLDNGQWHAVINGIAAGANLDGQTRIGQNLLHYAGIQERDVAVIRAVDLSGTFLVQTPVHVTEEELTGELSHVPGFSFVWTTRPATKKTRWARGRNTKESGPART